MDRSRMTTKLYTDSYDVSEPSSSAKTRGKQIFNNTKNKDKFPPPVLSENCLRVLEKRYLKKNEDGKVIEKPIDLFLRVAKNIASADSQFDPETDLAKT